MCIYMHKFKLIYNNVYIKFNQCVHIMKQSNKHNYFIIFSSFHTFNYINYKTTQIIKTYYHEFIKNITIPNLLLFDNTLNITGNIFRQ